MNIVKVIKDLSDLKYAVRHKLMDELSYDKFTSLNPERIIKQDEIENLNDQTINNKIKPSKEIS